MAKFSLFETQFYKTTKYKTTIQTTKINKQENNNAIHKKITIKNKNVSIKNAFKIFVSKIQQYYFSHA
jgi:hypothetical protein